MTTATHTLPAKCIEISCCCKARPHESLVGCIQSQRVHAPLLSYQSVMPSWSPRKQLSSLHRDFSLISLSPCCSPVSYSSPRSHTDISAPSASCSGAVHATSQVGSNTQVRFWQPYRCRWTLQHSRSTEWVDARSTEKACTLSGRGHDAAKPSQPTLVMPSLPCDRKLTSDASVGMAMRMQSSRAQAHIVRCLRPGRALPRSLHPQPARLSL